jgi:hypothetical protein
MVSQESPRMAQKGLTGGTSSKPGKVSSLQDCDATDYHHNNAKDYVRGGIN